MGILDTLAVYAILVVVLHPVLLILFGFLGIFLTAPTTSFGPSILVQYAPAPERLSRSRVRSES